MPRIIHVSSNYPPRLGGLERVVEELALHQSLQGLTVEVVSSNLGYQKSYKDKVSVTRLKAFEVAHTPIMPSLLWNLLKLNKSDIVHAHTAQAFMPETVWLASKFKKFEYISHIHLDVAPSGPAGALLKIYKPLILRRVLRNAKYVVVFSEEQKTAMVRQHGLQNDKVVIVPNGVDESFYHKKPRKLHKKPRLLFVGRLSTQKNLPYLFHALEGISEKFETHIAGDGELRSELEKLVAKLQLKNVVFHGRLDGDKLKEMYEQSDIFVLPSEREGMPLVLLEAMAMALPVIGTDVTGTRDLVKHGYNGLLAPLDKPAKMREILVQTIKNSNGYQNMSRASYADALNYTWSTVAKKFKDLYDA